MTDKIVIDLDGTIVRIADQPYDKRAPNLSVIRRIQEYKNDGFEIVIYTSRNMRTYRNSIGSINAHTLPTIVRWLENHSVPYDEIHVGKPWPGERGFYVDDRAIRPNEFANLSQERIVDLLINCKPDR